MERWLTKEEREAWERLQIAYVAERSNSEPIRK